MERKQVEVIAMLVSLRLWAKHQFDVVSEGEGATEIPFSRNILSVFVCAFIFLKQNWFSTEMHVVSHSPRA